jgi:MerR family transcriptional regulator, light-induced transcriptional regulator
MALDVQLFDVTCSHNVNVAGSILRLQREDPSMTNSSGWGASDFSEGGMEQLERLSEPLRYVTPAQSRSLSLEDLAATIENVIVPRLLMNHETVKRQWTSFTLDETKVEEFARIAMREDPDSARNFVQGLLDDGVAFDRILMDLLAPAARLLGDKWVNDTCTFTDVTIGVSRMHRILRDFRSVPDRFWSQAGVGHRALLLTVPGEQHTLGLRMVEEFLLREGWDVHSRPNISEDEIKTLVSEENYDFVGMSLSGETFVESMTSAISSVRAASKNRHINVMVGGVIFYEQPFLVAICGADAYAEDASGAVRQANTWAATSH